MLSPNPTIRRVLATDFGIWPTFASLDCVPDAMIASLDYRKRLANYLLLYDQIVIPTGNLQIIPVLREMLGEDAFDELVRSKGIVLARFDRWFGYVGNGTGLTSFQIDDPPDWPSNVPNIGTAFFRPLDQIISEVVSVRDSSSRLGRHSETINLLIDNIVELPTQAIADVVKDETYKDIRGSAYLGDFFEIRNAGRSLDSLLGATNQLSIFNPHIPSGRNENIEIQNVLRVAFENFLLAIGSHSEVTEITGDKSTLRLLNAKGQRLGFSPEGNLAFAKIQEVSDVPDLGQAYATKQISAGQLLDLRYSKHCQALRDWFAAGAPGTTADETLRRYVETIGKPSWIDAFSTKVLRFATTTAIGVYHPISGAAASAVDAFLLSKWFPGRSPRLFLEQAKVMLANTPVIQKPDMSGRDRDAPCSCGSGKKRKKCCGC